jgi:hypothetical protein
MTKHGDETGPGAKSRPTVSAEGLAAKQARAERSAEALRANLRRRKQQIQSRKTPGSGSDHEAS